MATVRRSGCDGIIIGSAALEPLDRVLDFFARWLDGIVVLVLLAVSLPLLLRPGLHADKPRTRNSIPPRKVLK